MSDAWLKGAVSSERRASSAYGDRADGARARVRYAAARVAARGGHAAVPARAQVRAPVGNCQERRTRSRPAQPLADLGPLRRAGCRTGRADRLPTGASRAPVGSRPGGCQVCFPSSRPVTVVVDHRSSLVPVSERGRGVRPPGWAVGRSPASAAMPAAGSCSLSPGRRRAMAGLLSGAWL